MSSLFLTDEDTAASAPIVAYRILRLLEEKGAYKISIFDVAEKFKGERWFSINRIHLGMLFLFALGLVDSDQPYIVKHA